MNSHKLKPPGSEHCGRNCQTALHFSRCETYVKRLAEKIAAGDADVLRRLCTFFRKKSEEKKEIVGTLLEIYMHKYHGKIFGKELHEQHTAVVEFVKEAAKQQISALDTLSFIDVVDHIVKLSDPKDMSNDQSPCLIALMNSYAYSYRIINHDLKTITPNCDLVNGTFSIATDVRSPEGIRELKDFDAMCYIVLHGMEKTERLLPPYCLVIDECDDFGSKQFREKRELVLARKNKLLGDARHAGKAILENDTWYIRQKSKTLSGAVVEREEKVFFAAVIRCKKTRQFYVVDEDGDGKKDVTFDKWKRLKEVKRQDVVNNHLENMRKHMKYDKDYDEYTKIKKAYAESECGDSRRFQRIAKGVVKLFGGIPTDKEFLDLAKDPERDQMRFNLHTFCGYVNKSIEIDRMLKEIAELTKNDPALRAWIARMFQKILRNENFYLDYPTLYGLFQNLPRTDKNGETVYGLSKKNSELLWDILFSGDDSKRSLIRHTAATHVFCIDEEIGLPRMAAVMEIDKALARLGTSEMEIGEKAYQILVLEQVAFDTYDRLIELYIRHYDGVTKARAGKPEFMFEVCIADIKKGGFQWALTNTRPSDASSFEELMFPYRDERKTGEVLDISYLWGSQKGALSAKLEEADERRSEGWKLAAIVRARLMAM